MIRATLLELSQHYGLRMEEPLQQEIQELDDKNPNEDQGGIRHRLRDRELLRKRRAEAEEKETNQEESQRKRSRAGQKSGARKRGRPRKTEASVETAVTQDDTTVAQEPPAVVVIPEPVEVISDQTQSSLTPLFTVGEVALESQPIPVTPAPVPMLASLQTPDPAPPQSSPAPVPVDPIPALGSPSVPVSVPAEVLEPPPIPVQESSPAPEAGLLPSFAEAPVPASAPPPPPSDPPQVKAFYTETQDREALDQVLIEDLGPDEEEDIYPSQDKSVDEDLSDKALNGASEQTKIFSNPTLSSPSPPSSSSSSSGIFPRKFILIF
ncbi:pollen-specific leucine-rich repeat extensin-like protein 1 isoform X2 [Sphaeramia orbicularis]|uniref:pollen-specific leucine-rich repeat extensin-like protein 1 isoform X2 n=1 Tax=Sphaeramia orbicularis TaxID=375764 RepID=UPI00117DE74B|nr:pollen-specific leucine-rich repeat extensin-like protein 1 isoform X2 [Sphaeramia orbicularis]